MTALYLDDLAFFAHHPRRSHRLRRAFPGEWGAPATATIVRQIELGVFRRIAVSFSSDDVLDLGISESIAWAAYDHAMIAVECGEDRVVWSAVTEWASSLSAGHA